MNKEIYYSNNDKLKKKIRRNRLIPYRITSTDYRFKLNKTYYSSFWGQSFEVISKEFSDENKFIGYYIKWEDDKYGFYNSSPEIYKDLILEKDVNNISDIKSIINTGQVYTGAEIVYWFFINNINYMNKKYRGFWKYVDTFSKFRIADNALYKVTGKLLDGVYVDCKMIRCR